MTAPTRLPTRTRFLASVLTALAISFVICSSGAVAQDSSLEPLEAQRQSFEEGTAGWIGNETSGAEGWCGNVERRVTSDGDLAASAGDAYAVVMNGPCNAYWQEEGFETSGPYSPAGSRSEWPEAGYTTELDVYLDPADPVPFTYAASVFLPDPPEETASFRYFYVPVTAEAGQLRVRGTSVSEPGWYTLHTTFGSADGSLTAEFALLRGEDVLVAEPFASTGETDEATSSLSVSALGTGYIWFVTIEDGAELPIDEHRVVLND